MANIPKHYQNGKIYDLIDVIEDFKLNFNRGNVLKYVCRAGKKENEVEDAAFAVVKQKNWGRVLIYVLKLI